VGEIRVKRGWSIPRRGMSNEISRSMVGLTNVVGKKEGKNEEREEKAVFKLKGEEQRNAERNVDTERVGATMSMDPTNNWGSSEGGCP
jgi:hypothetical protein